MEISKDPKVTPPKSAYKARMSLFFTAVLLPLQIYPGVTASDSCNRNYKSFLETGWYHHFYSDQLRYLASRAHAA
jgi:hypothetical protein